MERQYTSHAATATNTATVTATARPRHGRGGITRSKLEVDECIAAALREDNGTNHQEPGCRYGPARQARDGGFQRNIAQRPVRCEEEHGDDADLQNFAGAKKSVTR